MVVDVDAGTLAIGKLVAGGLGRKTEKLGAGITTNEEFEEVREVRLPLAAIAGAHVRKRWWEFWRGPRLILNANDLEAFDVITGQHGLRLAHPAQLILGLRFRDRLPGEEFAAELEMAVAKHVLEASYEPESLAPGPPQDRALATEVTLLRCSGNSGRLEVLLSVTETPASTAS